MKNGFRKPASRVYLKHGNILQKLRIFQAIKITHNFSFLLNKYWMSDKHNLIFSLKITNKKLYLSLSLVVYMI